MYLTVLFLSFAFAVAMGLVAFCERNYNMAQMTARGIKNPFPFTRHLGMWSDIFLLPSALAIMSLYYEQWESWQIWTTLGLSFIVTFAMHIMWINQTDHHEHILSKKGGLTGSGMMHVVYMTLVLATIALFYFAGEGSPRHEIMVGIMLMIHVAVGTMGVSWMKTKMVDAGSMVTTAVCWVLLVSAMIW